MTRIIKIIFLFFFIALLWHSYALSKEKPSEETLITLYVGEIKIISVDIPNRIAVTNPEVADVNTASNSELVIMAQAPGTTSVIWWDSLGQHALQLQVFAENMKIIEQRVNRIINELHLPDVYTRSADSEGKVLLLGKVKVPEDLERVDTALGELNSKTVNLIKIEEEEASIEIDMQILEIQKDSTRELGINLPTSLTISEPPVTAPVASTAADNSSAIFDIISYARSALSSTINFLVQEGKARILSRPRLVCQSGKEAEFLVGGEKPILTTAVVSGGGSSTEVEYKEYGIKLTIRPKVMSRNRIQVSLDVEVSELQTVETIGSDTTTTASAYPLLKRSTSTQLILDNSQTLAISGLIKQKTAEELKKFPWLGDIPIIGLFFRNRKTMTGGGAGELGDTELVITLTPTILSAIESSLTETSEGGMIDNIAKTEKMFPAISLPAITGYTRTVIRRIQDNFSYPQEAYQGDIEGLVYLALHLASSGQLIEIEIRQSSGYEILDDNAVKIIERVAPFPPFPSSIKEKELWVNIPINYSIK